MYPFLSLNMLYMHFYPLPLTTHKLNLNLLAKHVPPPPPPFSCLGYKCEPISILSHCISVYPSYALLYTNSSLPISFLSYVFCLSTCTPFTSKCPLLLNFLYILNTSFLYILNTFVSATYDCHPQSFGKHVLQP